MPIMHHHIREDDRAKRASTCRNPNGSVTSPPACSLQETALISRYVLGILKRQAEGF